jgi:hypothetical protein
VLRERSDGLAFFMKEDIDQRKERPPIRERRASVQKTQEEFISPVNQPSINKEEYKARKRKGTAPGQGKR